MPNGITTLVKRGSKAGGRQEHLDAPAAGG